MRFKDNVVLLFSSIFLALMTGGMVNVVLPLYLKDLTISLVGMGLIFSLAPIIGMIIQSTVAAHSDIVGRKGYFSITFLLKSIAYGLYSICKIAVGFAALNILDSLSQYLRAAVEKPLLVDISPKGEVGRTLGAYWGIFGIAAAIGILISGVILLLVGYFCLFLLCSVISFAGFIISQIAAAPAFKRRNIHFNIKKTFNFKELSWNLKILFLSGFLIGFAISVVERFALPIFLQQDLKADPTLIGITIGLAWLAMGIPPMIWRGMTDAHSPVKLYVFGLGFAGFAILFMSVTPDLLSTMSLYVLNGFFWGFAGPANMKLLADSAKSGDRARDMNLSGLGSGLGMMVGSVGSGIISEIAGFRPLFVISGVLSLASALIILSAIRGYK